MIKIRLAFHILCLMTLNACFQSSKFGSNEKKILTESNPPADMITIPSVEDAISTNPTGGTTLVNGGWSAVGAPWWANISNNTQYVTKFCIQPRPLNGGAECVKESGWQHGIKDGIQYAFKATAVCRNNFVWNGSECREVTNVAAPAGFVADMTQYWPWPVDGTAFVKIFARETGNPQTLIQKHIRSPDGTYQLIDVYYNPAKGKHEWHSTWHYRLDSDRGVIEFKDDFANVETQELKGTSEFAVGHELMHGKIVSKGTEVTNTLKNANGTPAPGSHMWFQVFEIYSKFYALYKEFNNVVGMNIKQTFCPENGCDDQQGRPGQTFYTHFYLAPQIGFVKQVYLDSTGSKVEGEANLVQYCTTSSDKWSCD